MKVCRSRDSQRRPRPTRRTHYIDEENQDPDKDVYSLFALKSEACEPIKNMTINGVSLEMELDTGAAYYTDPGDLSEDCSIAKHPLSEVF